MDAFSKKNKWWENGVRFECQGSGKCCTSHGEFGFVFLDLNDRRRMAKQFKMRTSSFTRKYCEFSDGQWHLIERAENPDCLFLKNKRCSVYEARPEQCRTWPFWPEVMNAKAWNKEVVQFCPGANKGKIISGDEIEKILKTQLT